MLRDLRTNYQKSELGEDSINSNPFEQLKEWLKSAIEEGDSEPTAMVLSTVDLKGHPDSRVVLLKEINSGGLVFFTNYHSEKGKQISENGHVSLVFFWAKDERQVRVKGIAERISEADSEAYFLSRPLESQLGAWASPQSETIGSRKVLDDNYAHCKQYFESREITKPPHWGGFLIRPQHFEFWQGRENRLHDRLAYNLTGEKWIIQRLAP